MDSDSFKRDLVTTGYDNIHLYGQWFISERFGHDWLWQHLLWICNGEQHMDSDSFKRDLVMTGHDNIYYE